MAPYGGNEQSPNREGMLTFEADLRKSPGSRLGIDVVLVSSPQGCGLVVERVNEGGLVEAWNRRSREPMRIRSGDFIIRVNGVEGEISALAGELRSGADVRITVQRAAQDDAPQTWKDLQASIMRKRPGQEKGGTLGQQAPVELSNSTMPAGMYPGPVGLPGHQGKGVNPKAPGVSGWGTPGFQHVGMPPNYMQGAEHGHWQGNRWPGNQWALADGAVETDGRLQQSRVSIGASEPGDSESMEATPENTFTFEVTLSKPERARLGIDVMPHTVSQAADFCGLTVKRVSKGGVVDEWNQQCRDPRAQVCPGDRIVRVNGVTSDFAQMWEILCTQRELNVIVRRICNQMSSFSQGHQTFGVGPVQLPGRSVPMLENAMRPAITETQAAKAPPAITLPNQNQTIAAIARDGSTRAAHIGFTTASGNRPLPSSFDNSGNTGTDQISRSDAHVDGIASHNSKTREYFKQSGEGFGKGGSGSKGMPPPSGLLEAVHQGGMPAALHNHTLIAGSNAQNLVGEHSIRFDVTLEHSKTKRVGIDVIMVSGNQLCGFVVERVMEGGRVDLWNKQSQPPHTVQTGDYIVQVNGMGNWQSLSKMAEEFVKEGRQVSFTIQRPPASFQNHWGKPVSSENASDKRNAKESKRREATEASEDRGAPGSEQFRPEPPLPTAFSKMSPPGPPPPPPQARSGSLRQALSASAPPGHEAPTVSPEEAVVEEAADTLRKPSPPPLADPPTPGEGYPEPPPEPPPGLPLPPQDMSLAPNIPPPPPPPRIKDGKEQPSTTTSLVSSMPPGPPPPGPPPPASTSSSMPPGPPPSAPPPPPRKAADESGDVTAELEGSVIDGPADEDDIPDWKKRVQDGNLQPPSSADREVEANRGTTSGRGRSTNSAVTPIGTGRGIGRGTEIKAPLEESAKEDDEETLAAYRERLEKVFASQHQASKIGESQAPATLLAYSLQLHDQDLASLLRAVLSRKPWLRVAVTKALDGGSLPTS